MSVETVWEEPGLFLAAAICVIMSWVKPFGWILDNDVGNHSNLVHWCLESLVYCYLILQAIDLGGQTLSDGTCVSPYSLFFGIAFMRDSSVRWRKYTRCVLHVLVIFVPPLPCFNITALNILSSWWVALAVFGNTCGSMFGDIVLFTVVIFNILMNLSIFKCIRC